MKNPMGGVLQLVATFNKRAANKSKLSLFESLLWQTCYELFNNSWFDQIKTGA